MKECAAKNKIAFQQNASNALAKTLSSAFFADDLLGKTNRIQNLKIQAHKFTLYSDWAALVVSYSKTRVKGILHSHPPKDKNGVTPSQALHQ
eukprot:1144802-Pelagomonas_calceolata.AAC.1